MIRCSACITLAACWSTRKTTGHSARILKSLIQLRSSANNRNQGKSLGTKLGALHGIVLRPTVTPTRTSSTPLMATSVLTLMTSSPLPETSASRISQAVELRFPREVKNRKIKVF